MPITDIREKVLSGQLKLKQEAVWVPQWDEWVMVRELNGKERASVIEANTYKKGSQAGQINVTNFYPHLAIASARYPTADVEPAEVEVPVTDENGEPVLDANKEPVTKLVPSAHLAQYPSLDERQGNPLAGMLIFRRSDDPTKPDLAVRDALNETSGAALEVIAQVAARLSALLPQDIAEKKGS